MIILSIYVLVELSIEIIWTFSPQTSTILERVDLAVCSIFMVDFLYYFNKAESKKKYIKSRWIDFVSSIPFVGVFRLLRIARVVRFIKLFRLMKILRGAKGSVYIFRFLFGSKLQNILISYILILIVVIFYASLAFYSFEKEVNPNINEYFDSIWWSFITVTSVGYGDVYPITKIGKIIAMVLTLSGMGLFSVVTAELAAKFLTYIRIDSQDKE